MRYAVTRILRRGARALVLLAAASAAAEARSGDVRLDRAIRKANSEWAAAMKTGDIAAIVDPYTDASVFVGTDGSCVKGRVEIEKLYRARFASRGLAASTRIESKSLVVDGDLAYESGFAEIGWSAKGRMSSAGGRFLTVWQRQAGGDWKILRNIVLP